ncbi:unnamed protein product [Caenorhabditis bovis]|uniref:Uncharacterized protein n=1 Tax=Caenorhabditis bovis TaxID=2654633 RepID=A0A8S1F402_9PELO|nr:unnamed protein product [Caenorhabditis bovis]
MQANRNYAWLESTLFVTAFSLWVCSILREIPIRAVPVTEALKDAIGHSETCSFSLEADDKRGIILKNFPLEFFDDDVLKQKFQYVVERIIENPYVILEWFGSQLDMNPIFFEAIFSQYVLGTLVAFVVLGFIIDLLLIQPISNRLQDVLKLEAIEKREKTVLQSAIKKFVARKLIILCYVIVPQGIDSRHEEKFFKDFASFVNSQFQMFSKFTDITFFAIWFILVGFLFIIAQTINTRFEWTIRFCNNENRKLQGTTAIVSLIVLLFGLFMISIWMVVIGLLSSVILYPPYAVTIVLYAILCVLNTGFVMCRICFCFSASNAEITGLNDENGKPIVDDEIVSRFVALGGHYYKSLVVLRIVYQILTHLIGITIYAIIMVVGTCVNHRLLAILFYAPIASHFRQLFSIDMSLRKRNLEIVML